MSFFWDSVKEDLRVIQSIHPIENGTQLEQWDRDYFPFPWPKGELESFVKENSEARLFCLFKGRELCGFLLGKMEREGEQFYLYKILIHPDLRGKRLGEFLLFRAFKILKKEGALRSCFCEVETSNREALFFYEKMGFKKLCLRKGFYSKGGDAFALEWLF